MLLVLTIATSMDQQVAKCLQIRKHTLLLLGIAKQIPHTHIVTTTELKEVILWAASLSRRLTLYNHFNTHEA